MVPSLRYRLQVKFPGVEPNRTVRDDAGADRAMAITYKRQAQSIRLACYPNVSILAIRG